MKIVLCILVVLVGGALAAESQTLGFDDQKPGEAPKGMTCALTGK